MQDESLSIGSHHLGLEFDQIDLPNRGRHRTESPSSAQADDQHSLGFWPRQEWQKSKPTCFLVEVGRIGQRLDH